MFAGFLLAIQKPNPETGSEHVIKQLPQVRVRWSAARSGFVFIGGSTIYCHLRIHFNPTRKLVLAMRFAKDRQVLSSALDRPDIVRTRFNAVLAGT